MKKKFLNIILALLVIVPCFFAITACGETLGKADLAAEYKTVAKTSWQQLGAGDPTVVETSGMSISKALPNEMKEQTEKNSILYIKSGGATMAALVNMIGEYYENEDFIVTDKILSFDANMLDPNSLETYKCVLSLRPSLNKRAGKVTLEMNLVSDGMQSLGYSHVESYYNFEIDFDFKNGKMVAFYMLNVQTNVKNNGEDYLEINEMQMTKDGKYFGNEDPSDEFKAAVKQLIQDFNSEIQNGITITGNFDEEFNRYSDNANKACQNVYASEETN